jgi:nucleoid DNA-binding protein
MTQKFQKALVEVLRDQLLNQKIVHIHGLGSFRVDHKKQYTTKTEEGKSVIMPPRDVIIFTSEKK